MIRIYYKDGIYICLDRPNSNWESSINFINGERESQIYLYGGRVNINYFESWQYPVFSIDGIPIINKEFKKEFSLMVIASHLNAIETNGVDAFLKHYKASVEFLYGELKEMNQKMELLLASEHDTSKVKNILSEIDKLRKLLLSVLTILFSLNSFMSAGLENERVISVCQSIMDTIS